MNIGPMLHNVHNLNTKLTSPDSTICIIYVSFTVCHTDKLIK